MLTGPESGGGRFHDERLRCAAASLHRGLEPWFDLTIEHCQPVGGRGSIGPVPGAVSVLINNVRLRWRRWLRRGPPCVGLGGYPTGADL